MGDGEERRELESGVSACSPGSEARVVVSGCVVVADTSEEGRVHREETGGATDQATGCAHEAEATGKSVRFSDSHSLDSYQQEMGDNKITGLRNLELDASGNNHNVDGATNVRATEELAYDFLLRKGESRASDDQKKESDLAQKVCLVGDANEASMVEGLARPMDQGEAAAVAESGNSAESSLKDTAVINSYRDIGHQLEQIGLVPGNVRPSGMVQMEHSEEKLEITMSESLNAIAIEGKWICDQYSEENKGGEQHNTVGTQEGPCLEKEKRSMNEEMQISPADTLQGDENLGNSKVSLMEDGCGCPQEHRVDLSDGQCGLEAPEKLTTANIEENVEAEVCHLGSFSDVGMVQDKVSAVSNNVDLSKHTSSMAEENQGPVNVAAYNVVGENSHALGSRVASKNDSRGEAMIVESTDGTVENKDGLSLEISRRNVTQALNGEAKMDEWSLINSDQDNDSSSTLTAYPNKEVEDGAIHEQEINLHDSAENKYNLNSENLRSPGPDMLTNHQFADANIVSHNSFTVDRCDSEQVLTEVLLVEKVVGTKEREDENLADENVNEKENTSLVAPNSISDARDMVSKSRGPEFEEIHEDLEGDGAYHSLYSAGEDVMDKEYFAMEGLNLSVEISMPRTSELSEIQDVFSLAIDSTEDLLDKNQEAQYQTLSSAADGISSLGFCRSADGNGTMEADSNAETGCSYETNADKHLKICQGDFSQDENLADISDAMIVDEQGMVRNQEPAKGSDKLTTKQMTTRAGTSKENDQHARYCLPFKDEDGFSVSDLVWGKVKSHPWWPGQIFDPSDASDLALKHQKKDNFLVAYFADKTFAWCDESQLKPFCLYFSQMEKQSSSDVFLKAVGDVLEEVSRRIELGMTCFCQSPKANFDVTRQKVENAGIHECYTGCVVERSYVISHFKPSVLLAYIKDLAQMAAGGADKLDFVIAKAHLKSFYRSKGYSDLPCFQTGIGGLSESDAGVQNFKVQDIGEDGIGKSDVTPPDLEVRNQKLGGNDIGFNKEKHIMSAKEEKSFSELSHEATCRTSESKGRVDSEEGLIACDNKRQAPDSDSSDSERRKKKKLDSLGDGDIRIPSQNFGSSFKLGACISRVASQLTGSPSILKTRVEAFQKNIPKDSDVFDVFVSDAFQDVILQSPSLNIGNWEDYSLDELLLQLYFAATDPMTEYDFHSTIMSFFSEFRNYCVVSSTEKNLPEKVASKRGRKRKVDIQVASSDVLTTDHMKDSYWSDLIPSDKPVDGLRSKGQPTVRGQRKRRKSSSQTCSCVSLAPILEAELQETATINQEIKQLQMPQRSIISVEEKMVGECTPTALILDFNGSKKPLPSRTDIIRTFSRYGPLKEAAIEVQMKYNRVKVVFKRRDDAEMAFNSAGKYSIFGPSLLSYCLRYLPSMTDSFVDIEPQDKSNAASYEDSRFETSDQAHEEIISDDFPAETTQIIEPGKTVFQVYELEDETCQVDEMPRRAVEVDEPSVKVDFQVDESANITSQVEEQATSWVDESVEIDSKTEEQIWVAAQDDNLIETAVVNEPFEADTEPVDTAFQVDERVKNPMLVDEPVETAAQVHEPIETAVQVDEHAETTAQGDEPVGIVAEPDEAAAQVYEQVEVDIQVDELVEMAGNVEKFVETAAQVDKRIEIDAQVDGMAEIDAKPAKIFAQVNQLVEVAMLVDEPLEAAELVDEHVESIEQVAEHTEIYAQLHEPVEIAAKMDGPVNMETEPVITAAQVDEQGEISMQVCELVEIADQVDKPVETFALVDQYVEKADRMDKQVEIAAQPDEQDERAAQAEENIEVAAQVDKQVEIAAQEYQINTQGGDKMEIVVQVGKWREIAMQVDEPVKTSEQVNRPIETVEEVERHVEIAEQVDKCLEIAVRLDEQVERAAQVNENIEVASQMDEQVEIAAPGDEMTAQVYEQVEIVDQVDKVDIATQEGEHIEISGGVDEQAVIVNQVDEPVGKASHMNEPVKIANQVDEPILSTSITVEVDKPVEVSVQVDEPIAVDTQLDELVEIASPVDEPAE